MNLIATAFEEARISSREDGNYWLVRIPDTGRLAREKVKK
jgi:hypothetical protein